MMQNSTSMMPRFLFAHISVIALLLGGCASMFVDSKQEVKIETLTPDGKILNGARCNISNDPFEFAFIRSGETASVKRSKNDLTVNCWTDGLPVASGKVISRMNAGMILNLPIAGGLVGGIGAAVDHNNGSGYTYPSTVQLMFGEKRVFDQRLETEGEPMTGKEQKRPAPESKTQ